MPNPEAPSHNPYETRDTTSAEYRREADPAAHVVDAANELRNAAISAGATPGEIDAYFAQDETGRAGAFEMAKLAEEIRHRALTDPTTAELLPYEQKFIDHMALERQYDTARAAVDFKAMRASEDPNLSPEEAELSAIRELQSELSRAVAQLTGPEKAEAEGKLQVLRDYLALTDDERKGGEHSIERNFMRAGHAAESVTGPQAKSTKEVASEMEGKLDEYDERTTLRIMAYEILKESYPRTPDTVPTDLPEAPELTYVDPNAPTPDAPVDAPAAPATPARNPDVVKMEQAAIMEMEENELVGLRKEMAELKAGGRINNFFKGGARNGAERRARLKHLEATYNSAVVRKQMRQYGDLFADPSVDPKVKNYLQVKSLFAEQEMLRTEMNDVLQNTKVAKIARWIGKHKLIVAGTGILLAPMTFGASAGVGLALSGGLIAASKIDTKTRGLGTFGSSITQEQLLDYMNSGHSYQEVVRYASTINKRDLSSEKVNRTVLSTLGGVAAGAVGYHYFGALDGMSHALYGANHYVKGTVDAGVFANMVKNDKK